MRRRLSFPDPLAGAVLGPVAWCARCRQHVPVTALRDSRRLLHPHRGRASDATGWKHLPCPGSGAVLPVPGEETLDARERKEA